MKKLILSILIILLGTAVNVAYILDNNKTAELQELYHKAWEKKAIKKYKLKSNRLRVYTDLVYNTKYGVYAKE